MISAIATCLRIYKEATICPSFLAFICQPKPIPARIMAFLMSLDECFPEISIGAFSTLKTGLDRQPASISNKLVAIISIIFFFILLIPFIKCSSIFSEIYIQYISLLLWGDMKYASGK